MVLWIGVDDTDSLQGMCTTFLATEIVRELTRDLDLIGYPRLVRLNPNVPWKTRGNGAVCVRVGKGLGDARVVGRMGGATVRAFPRGRSSGESEAVVERVARIVERWSHFDDANTNPGFAVLRYPARPSLYWRAVRTIVNRAEAMRSVGPDGVVRGYKNGRGVIGALAATAWRPRDRTYEVISYRREAEWGSPRWLDPSSVVEVDRNFPSTFNNYDYENRRVVIAPRSPCPVLFGIRGDDPGVLPQALDTIRSEPPERWMIFETNQGTDDHVVEGPPTAPHTTVRFRGAVTTPPRTLRGGHVVFSVGDYPVSVYEPSKGFRNVIRGLARGDRVQVIGAVRDLPRTLNLEKLRVYSLVTESRKVGNPMCPACRKRMKSEGRGAGFRCRMCGRHAPMLAADYVRIPRTLSTGWYEPPVGSRRHLSRPLKRSGRSLDARGESNTYTGPSSREPGLLNGTS